MRESDETAIGAAFFEEMVESVGVGVAIYGAEGTYLYVNDAYADLLETDRERLVGTAIWEVTPSFERARFEDYWQSFDDGETRVTETEHTFEGTTVPVTTVTTRRTIDGSPYHFGTIRDISELKAHERELQRQNERLEAFAGIVAHDLRNPLNVAKSYLELLDQDLDREELRMMDSALSRMEMLITDLLELAKQGEVTTEPEPVPLAAVARRAWDNVDTATARLATEADRQFEADQGRLQQLFENLFRNAVEHGSSSPDSRQDDVTITVGLLDAEDGFFVADDGPGIPADERETVFEPGASSADSGTGFGLAIVAEIAKAHDWDVSVTESADGGARFEFVTEP